MPRRPLSRHLRVQVLARDGYRCLMCGRSKEEVALEVDHVIPVADGGTDELHNLATLCRDCNGGKSAYRFTDYRSVTVIPPNLESHFRFSRDDRVGDFQRYHLYLDFKNGVHPGSNDEKFHHSWTISGTRYDTSSDASALEQRRRAEEQCKFLIDIRRRLVVEGKRLVKNEEGICRIDG
jgi:HNH endonuclease